MIAQPRLIPIYTRAGVHAWALVDEEDYERISQHRWCFNKGRARRRGPVADGKQTTIFMHREVMDLVRGDGLEADHINHATLDNRRANLRVVTHAQNQQNRLGGYGASPHRGVDFDKTRGKWRVQLCVEGRRINRYCNSEAEAARLASELRSELMPYAIEDAA